MSSCIVFIPHSSSVENRQEKQIYNMQVLTVLVITMAALFLASTAVKASPVLPIGEDEPSLQDLSKLPTEHDKEFKRICGLTRYGCVRKGGVNDTLFLYHCNVCSSSNYLMDL